MKNNDEITAENTIVTLSFDFTISNSRFADNVAMSGMSTTDSADIIVIGAMMSGRAIPDTLPNSAVARLSAIPPDTSLRGMTSAVSDDDREVSIRMDDRGIVAVIISLVPCGFVIRPPDAKKSTIRTSTQSRSLKVNASATPFAPVSPETSPLVKITASTILPISSTSSVDEKLRNFFRPQNQLRKDEYTFEVTRVGSITRKIGKHLSSENRKHNRECNE